MFDIQVELNDDPDQIRGFTGLSLEKSKLDEIYSILKFLTPEPELPMGVTDLLGPEPEEEDDEDEAHAEEEIEDEADEEE